MPIAIEPLAPAALAPGAVTLVPAAPAHIAPIAGAMRAIDRCECAAMGYDPDWALRISLAGAAQAWTALVGDVPHAMFGVESINAIERTGRIWFLGSDAVLRHGRALLTTGRRILAEMSGDYAELSNFVGAENAAAIALLRRWGFTIEKEGRMIRDMPFVRFWRAG